MAGDGRKGAADAHCDPVGTGGQQVFDILEGREAHPHAHGIHNAIHPFIEILALAQEQPQHEQLGGLFRNGGAEEGTAESVHATVDFCGEQAQPHKRHGDTQRGQYGGTSVEKRLHQVPGGLPLQFILLVHQINQNEGRQHGQDNDR